MRVKIVTYDHEWQGLYCDTVIENASYINDDTITFKSSGKDWVIARDDVVFAESAEVYTANTTNQPKAIKSDGGSSSYYDFEIPQHYLDKINETGIIKTEWLIDFMFKNDFDFACAFKALVRARGIVDGAGKEGNTLSYELNKNRYYSDKIEEKHGN